MTSRLKATKSGLLLLPLYGAIICASHTLAAVDSKPGTSKDSAATLDEVITAITNALGSCRYHGMGLVSVPDQFDTVKRRWTTRPATNEWVLDTYNLPVSVIPRGKNMVPYHAQFLITAEQIATNKCRVTVTTMSASIPDGREIGIHGGWAVRQLAPAFEPPQPYDSANKWQCHADRACWLPLRRELEAFRHQSARGA